MAHESLVRDGEAVSSNLLRVRRLQESSLSFVDEVDKAAEESIYLIAV